MALVPRRKAWQHQDAKRKDRQSKRAVRRAKVKLKKPVRLEWCGFLSDLSEKLRRNCRDETNEGWSVSSNPRKWKR